MTRILPLAEAKKNLSAIISDVEDKYDRFTITKNGVSTAVILSSEEYEGLLETLDILSGKEERDAIKRAKREIKDGRTMSLSAVRKRYGMK
jgi:antitoxin YefM